MEGGHSYICYNKVDTIIQLNLSNIHREYHAEHLSHL